MKKAFLGRSRPSDQEILDNMAQELVQFLLKQGKPIVRQILITANANGFPVEYLQYVFWVLVEGQNNWPSLTREQKDALSLLRSILVNSGDLPSYRSGLEIPPGDTEIALDDTLRDLSIWMQKMAAPFGREYLKLLKKYEKTVQKNNPDVPKGMGFLHLKAQFETALRNRPQNFSHGQLLHRALSTLLW